MSNSKRMEQLGLPSFYLKKPAVHVNKNKSKQGNTQDSDSEYDPLRDDTVQGDLFENNAKGSKEKTCKKTKKPTSDLPPGGVKFRSRKRVFPDMPSIEPTKSQKRRIAQPDASVAPSEVHLPNVSQASLTREVHVPNVSQAAELVGNFDVRTQDPIEDDGLNLPGDNTHMTNEAAGHNGDAFAQHEDNEFMADGITHSGGQNQMNNEGEEEEWNRGVNMGHGLQRLTRAQRSKLPIVIAEGKIRPMVPVIAAKWATECNIIVRNHIPALTHWKEYKRRPGLIKMFQDKLSAKFDMDTRDPVIKKACMGMMNNAVRQQRYRG
ncbi:unnamed protein product [Urochloa humidicola]